MADRGWRWVAMRIDGFMIYCQAQLENLEKPLPEVFRIQKTMEISIIQKDGKTYSMPKVEDLLWKGFEAEAFVYGHQVAAIWPMNTKFAETCEQNWAKTTGAKPALSIVKGEDAVREVLDSRPPTEEEMGQLAAIAARNNQLHKTL